VNFILYNIASVHFFPKGSSRGDIC